MAYKLEITRAAQADLARLDRPVLDSVRKRLQRLAETADQIAHLPLKGELSGVYKLRVHGKYRVIYDLNREKQIIIVVRVGKRDEVYKD